MSAEQNQKISQLLRDSPYDLKTLPDLENHVVFQYKNNSYDADANRALLKLYAVKPDMVKIDVLGKLFIKSLMALPSPDFQTNLYLVPEKLHGEEPLKSLIKLNNLLEQGSFKKFWKELEAVRAVAFIHSDCQGFDDAIRAFISIIIGTTYTSITSAMLRDYWNLSDKAAFDKLVDSLGWTRSDDGKTINVKKPAQPEREGQAPRQPRTEHPSVDQIAKLLTSLS